MIKKLLLSLLAIFGFTFLFSSDTFAKDDITVPVSNSFTQICSSDSTFTNGFCGYNYFIVSLDRTTTDIICRAYDLNGTEVGNSAQYSTRSSTYLVLNDIRFDGLSYNSISCRAMTFITGSFTLTDKQPSFPTGSISITENGTFDVSNYASATVLVPEGECEDCDTPFIVSLFKDGFWGVMTALVSLIVPVLALFLIFRLVHDWLWGKG